MIGTDLIDLLVVGIIVPEKGENPYLFVCAVVG